MCRQGDPAACLYLLLDGVVENSVILEDGRKKINMLYTGMSLLGVSCLDEEVCMVNLRCLTRVRTARVHRQAVRGLAAGDAAAGGNVPDLQDAGRVPAAAGTGVSVYGGTSIENTGGFGSVGSPLRPNMGSNG